METLIRPLWLMEEQTFAEWIRQTRIAQGLRARECAERLGVTRSAWSHYENEHSRRAGERSPVPKRETVAGIAHALGVPENDALEAAGYLPNRMDGSSEMPRELTRESADDEPFHDEKALQKVVGLHSRIIDLLPPGRTREAYIQELTEEAEARLNEMNRRWEAAQRLIKKPGEE